MTQYDPSFSRILFGSCNSQKYEQRLWPAIRARHPTAFVWGGDAIYADENLGWQRTFPPRPLVRDATPTVLKKLYEEQRKHPDYRMLIDNPNITITGTLDDHDYGSNNGDYRYPHKRESAVAFMEFLGDTDSLMAKRANQGLGAYGVRVFDFAREPGLRLLTDEQAKIDPDLKDLEGQPLYSKKSVAVFLLDVRSNKTPWSKGRNKFQLNYDADFLGETQWKWLEQAVHRSKATVNVIVQGLPVHSDRYPDGNVVEEWSKFPMAQHRLYQAVLQVQAPILISGDVHYSQFLRKDCRRKTSTRTLLEVTTSGMTHSWANSFCSRPKTSLLCEMPYAQFVFRSTLHFAHWIHPWTDILLDETGAMQYNLERNFGELNFDWDRQLVTTRILDENQTILLTNTWSMEQLNAVPEESSRLTQEDFQIAHGKLAQHGVGEDVWTCVNYRGTPNFLHRIVGIVLSFVCLFALALFPFLVPLLMARLLLRRKT